MVKAVIEIPKGDTIRRYYNKSLNSYIDVGQLKDIIPLNDGVMPVNFGFIPGTRNQTDGAALDVLVVSDNVLSIGQELEIQPIAVLKREDGDDKVIAVETNSPIQSWDNVNADLKTLLLNYFGYKSKIVIIGGRNDAQSYIDAATIK